ncbi:DNA-binding domain-containing protein [Salipiger abyssi]|uniref:Putative DUF2063 protein n=1 Tax=Salipiger abyssi TaxID=1250539 RepID=A0A1P8UZE5_9RHOB|nr:DNA-binding domain-containing protein [Salipiger abyssi]APZ54736.1 putative DUF2063 protein [Salipiger abyssi]
MSQTAFHNALLDATRPVPQNLTDGMGRPAGRRYAVYRNNVAVSLSEALATGFPATAALLGETNFARLSARFLRQHPPTSPLLLHYGAGFPAFLDGIDGLGRLPFLSDIARLDLVLRRAYHAADAQPIAPEALAALDAETLPAARLHLVPAVQLLASRWPLVEIRAYALGERTAPPASAAQDVIVTRPGFDPRPHPLPAQGFAFATALRSGMRLGDAVTQCGPGFDPAATLALLLANGAIAAIDTGGAE